MKNPLRVPKSEISRWSFKFTLILLFLLAAPLLSHADESERLFYLINQRLTLMKDVAAYKYSHHIAIDNPQRENEVVRQARDCARRLSLQPDSVEAFFRLQIELAKIVQQGWIDTWQSGEEPFPNQTDIASLHDEIRPSLILGGEKILQQISRAWPELESDRSFESNLKRIEHLIDNPFLTDAMKHRILFSIIKIHKQPVFTGQRLKQILHDGVLRIGTTGDYQPFSYINSVTGQLDGIDIALATELAKSLEVRLVWEKTTWPTLLPDLAQDRFDMAMSGITRTLERQRVAFFSTPYHQGGKTAIARCSDASQLNSLEKTDQPNIRIIVNPGGSNERWVRQHIEKAQIVLYPDNNKIFRQIIDKKADVMFTDRIEVWIQQEAHPELCAAMPDVLLNRAKKGFLLPQDIVFKEYIDLWLHQLTYTGQLRDIFERYLGPSQSHDLLSEHKRQPMHANPYENSQP